MGNEVTELSNHSAMILSFKARLPVVARSLDEILRQERVLTDGEALATEELESSIQELNWYLLAFRKRIDRIKKKRKHE